MSLKTSKPDRITPLNKPIGSPKPQVDPITEQMLKGQKRYQELFSKVFSVIDSFDCKPIEVIRLGNEISAVGLEQTLMNTELFINKKIEDLKTELTKK